MEKVGDCKFVHGRDYGGNDERGGGEKGEKRAAPGGKERRAKKTKMMDEGTSPAGGTKGQPRTSGDRWTSASTRGPSPCGPKRLGGQHHRGDDTKVDHTGRLR